MARETKRTKRLEEMLPRGITLGARTDGRGKPFYVRYGADRRLESYVTERDRNDRAQQLMEAVETEGRAVMDFDPAEWKKYLLFKEETGVSLDEAREIVLRVKGNLRLNLSVTEAVEKYLAMREADGVMPQSFVHIGIHLRRFAVAYGHLPLFAVTADHVREWLTKMRAGKAEGVLKLGPQTLKHHRKNLNVFFERANLEKWALENPCAAVVPPKVAERKTPILTPREIFDILHANLTQPIVGRLVWELFGGLRCSSVARLLETDVKLASRGVLLRGSSVDEETGEWDQGHKSGRQKYRQGHPDVLWAWVEYCWPLPQPSEGPACFSDVTERNYNERKKSAFVRAGWNSVPHNRLRHCFASYLLALTKDRRLTSYLMQHSSWQMLERYEGKAEDSDAKLVLAMTPEAVSVSWEDFLKNVNQ